MTRVVVTGLGLITPLGVGVKHVWKNLIAGKSGIISTSELPQYEEHFSKLPCKVVGKVPSGPISEGKWDHRDHFEVASDARRLALFSQYALCAAGEALKDANWINISDEEKLNTGVCVGSGVGSFEDVYENSILYYTKGYKRVQPLFIPRLLTNMAAGNVSIRYGFKGPNHAVSTACATGVHSIGDAYRFIKDGYANVMVAGAAESSIHPLALAGFARAKSLVTKFNDEPEKASRPFDRDRDGFVLSEGGGMVVLEELEHAVSRNATIYAEIVGYGLSGDANHITAPRVDGDGAKRAMESAVKCAGIEPAQIDYINAHATSTAIGDRAENQAIKRIFATANPELSISSTKSSIGHLLGAAGSVESIFTILSVYHGIIPPTLNLENVGGHSDDQSDDFIFDYTPEVAKTKEIGYALCNSFGFGGTNATLCIKRFTAERK